MKHITITSILAIMIACPSFANIGKNENNPTCNNNTIGATSGTTNLEAQWTANTITLDYYSGDTKISTGSCSYDAGITLPSTPTAPTGYEFTGWRLRAAAAPLAQCDLSDFDYSNIPSGINNDGAHRWKPINGDLGDTMSAMGWTSNDTDLNNGEWEVSFIDGTVKGIALCSSTHIDDFGVIGTPNEQEKGENCWCKATKFTPITYSNITDGDAYIIGYKKAWQSQAFRLLHSLGYSDSEAKTLIKSASPTTPQLIKTNATKSEIETFINVGLIIQNVNTEIGNTCSINAQWVTGRETDDEGCENYCATDCALNIAHKGGGASYSQKIFGLAQ